MLDRCCVHWKNILNLKTHTVCWGLWWAGRTAGTWRRRTACVGTWCPPWGWVQTVSRGPGCRMAVGRTSSHTSPRPNPTSPQLGHSHCLQGPGERHILRTIVGFIRLDSALLRLLYWAKQTAHCIQWRDRWANKGQSICQLCSREVFWKGTEISAEITRTQV